MPRVAACHDVRSAILEASKRLIERYGYKKMTIDDIAREVGIGKATIYGYFENKQEIALAVVDSYHSELEAKWRHISRSNASASDRIRQMALTKVLSAFDNARRCSQSLDDTMATLKSLVIKKRGKYLEVDSLLMSQVIQEGVEAGEFVAGDTQALALTILVAVGGLMPYSLSPAELTKRDEVARQTNEVLDLLLKGLACRLPGSSTRRSMDLSAPQMQSK